MELIRGDLIVTMLLAMAKTQRIPIGILLIAGSAVSAADNGFKLEATPAWNGIYKTNGATEIMISLLSIQPGVVKVQTKQAFQKINLEANIPAVLSLPYKPHSRGETRIKTSSNNIPDASIEKQLNLTLSNSINIAVLGDGLNIHQQQKLKHSLSQIDRVKPFFVSSSTLPRLNVGYQPIDILILHFTALTRIDEQQTDALTHYISQCGKIVTLQFPTGIYNKLSKIAGCNGAFMSATVLPSNVTDFISQLISKQPAALPTIEEIKKIAAGSSTDSPYLLVLIFCLAYLLIMLFISTFSNYHFLLLILPLIATLSAIMVWFSQQPQYNMSSWIDMDTDRSTARYTALLNIHGAGEWHQNITLPADAIFSDENSDLEFQLSSMNYSVITTRLELALFSEQQWLWRSDTKIDAPLSLNIHQKHLSIKNISSNNSPSGFVTWKDKIHILPMLKPGQSWQTKKQATAKIESALTKLLRKYAEPYSAALIIPFTADILTYKTLHNAWLFIHTKQQEKSI